MALTTIAARAAAYGEAFRDILAILAASERIRETNRKNGSKAYQTKQRITDEFIEWAIGLPQPNQFDSAIHAALWFRDNELSASDERHAAMPQVSGNPAQKAQTIRGSPRHSPPDPAQLNKY